MKPIKRDSSKCSCAEDHTVQLTEANARLIADLLEALKEARVYVSSAYECAFPDAAENEAVLAQVDAAIKKAVGE